MHEEWKTMDFNPRYEVSNFGRFRKLNKKGYRYLKPYRKWNRNYYAIKLDSKEYGCAKLVATYFIRPLKENERVYHKNKMEFDNYYRNLEIITKKEYGKRTGYLSNSKRVVLIEDGEVKKFYRSARAAARDLYISKQTATDYCNNRYKKKIYDLRWEDDYFDNIIEKFSWEKGDKNGKNK